MSYKNTMKLFASNFTLVWKQLVYLICCLLLFSLCSYTIIKPIVDLLIENGLNSDLKMLFNTAYNNINELALRVSDVLKHIITTIFDNFSKIYLNFFGAIIMCVLLPYILLQMSIYNISSILYQKFTMNMDVNYIQNAVQTLKPSIRYAFANILFNLPFMALVVVSFELYLVISTTVFSSIIGLILLSALLIILNSVKISVFSYYTAYMVANQSAPFVAFGKSLISVLKNFWKILSISVVLMLTIIFVNGVITIFTFFAGLIVTIPASFVLISIYNLVTYFNIKGERYYLSNTIIYNPVKYTVKKDDYVSISVPEATKEIQVTTTDMKKKYKKTKTKSNKNKEIKINKKG